LISGTRGLEVLSDPLYSTFVHGISPMTHDIKEFFTDSEWDLIYNFIGNALDDDYFDPEDVYSVRNKIHSIFRED